MPSVASADIELDVDTHIYRNGGAVVPSVTQVLERTGLADYSMIPPDVAEFVKERGKIVHQAAHYMLEGDLDESTVDPLIAGYLHGLNQFMWHSEFRPDPGMIEVRVFDPIHWYAGTLDVTGTFPAIGRAVIDFKCGLMPAVRWQLAAYARLLTPPVYHRVALKLNKDGTYRVKPFPASTFVRDAEDFLAALRVYKMLEGIRR